MENVNKNQMLSIKTILTAIETVPVFNASGTKWQKKEDILKMIQSLSLSNK